MKKKDLRIDGYEKVTGRARYGADLRFDDMVYAKVRRSDKAHAKILKIDTSEAENVRGVLAVLTAKDIPGEKMVGAIEFDHYPLADDKVICYGDGVALVAAETEEIAEEAVARIKVEYEDLPAVFDIEEALKKDAPILKEGRKDNIAVHYPLRKGDIEKGFFESDIILEKEYKTQFVEHAYIEPEVVVAVPGEAKDEMKVYGSIQCPHSTRKGVARAMGTTLNNIRIIQVHMGGSFGGKDDVMTILSIRATLLARHLQRPVRMAYSREESIVDSYKRHPYHLKYKVGVSKDGRLKAMKVEMYADAGAYMSMTPFVTWRSVVQATGPYEIENVNTDIYGVFTNNPYTGAFRGFGSPQIIFAQESLIDELAEKIGMDGVELRKINGYENGSVTASGQRLEEHEVSLKKAMDIY